MVAVEANKGAADGAFWNEAPDRVSDLLIFLGIGYGLGLPYLGWAAATFAILTAYIRELGRASGVETDFSGPMAKPQRMALITGAAVIACFEPIWTGTPYLLYGALWGVVVGSAITAARRSNRLISALKSRP
jgi:phosphatidylglycerophosphate synthase